MPFGGFILLAFCAAGLKSLINRRFPEYSQETELEIKKTSVIVSKKNLSGETAVQTAQEPERETEPEDNNTEQIEEEPEENMAESANPNLEDVYLYVTTCNDAGVKSPSIVL